MLSVDAVWNVMALYTYISDVMVVLDRATVEAVYEPPVTSRLPNVFPFIVTSELVMADESDRYALRATVTDERLSDVLVSAPFIVRSHVPHPDVSPTTLITLFAKLLNVSVLDAEGTLMVFSDTLLYPPPAANDTVYVVPMVTLVIVSDDAEKVVPQKNCTAPVVEMVLMAIDDVVAVATLTLTVEVPVMLVRTAGVVVIVDDT